MNHIHHTFENLATPLWPNHVAQLHVLPSIHCQNKVAALLHAVIYKEKRKKGLNYEVRMVFPNTGLCLIHSCRKEKCVFKWTFFSKQDNAFYDGELFLVVPLREMVMSNLN